MIKQVINNILEGVLVTVGEKSILDHVNNLKYKINKISNSWISINNSFNKIIFRMEKESPIGSAVSEMLRYGQTDRQTNKQTDIPLLYYKDYKS